jgi:hypothetical protein
MPASLKGGPCSADASETSTPGARGVVLVRRLQLHG